MFGAHPWRMTPPCPSRSNRQPFTDMSTEALPMPTPYPPMEARNERPRKVVLRASLTLRYGWAGRTSPCSVMIVSQDAILYTSILLYNYTMERETAKRRVASVVDTAVLLCRAQLTMRYCVAGLRGKCWRVKGAASPPPLDGIHTRWSAHPMVCTPDGIHTRWSSHLTTASLGCCAGPSQKPCRASPWWPR